jgi:hypothetical protein
MQSAQAISAAYDFNLAARDFMLADGAIEKTRFERWQISSRFARRLAASKAQMRVTYSCDSKKLSTLCYRPIDTDDQDVVRNF